jgi:hypothetical protein
MKDPKYLDITEAEEHYEVKRIYIPITTPNTLRRIDYDPLFESSISECIRQANRIEEPQKRKEFLNKELEEMLG